MSGLRSLCFSSNPPQVPRHQQQVAPTTPLSPKPITIVSPAPVTTATHLLQINRGVPLLPDLSSQVKEKILCLEIMGIDSGKALLANPSLQEATLDSIHTVVSYLQSKGLYHKDMAKVLGMCPSVLTADVQADLVPVFKFLSQELSVQESNYRRVINKCPRLLISSVRDQLFPAIFYLRTLGFKDNDALAYNDPVLLVSSVERTLMPKLEYLQSTLGLKKEEVVAMVLRCPGLFTFSIENNFKPKHKYFVDEMGGDVAEIRDFPQYFAFSLEKRIKPRHQMLVESGFSLPLSVMLKRTDEEFRHLILERRRTWREEFSCNL